MMVKLFGACLVLVGCACVGWGMAAAQVREENSLRTLLAILENMSCEMQYMHTPLPQLCRSAVVGFDCVVTNVFTDLAEELEAQVLPNAELCLQDTLEKHNNLPPYTVAALRQLGGSLGKFDLNGQMKGIELVMADCQRKLDALQCNKDSRLRSYRTLGICAGVAMVIILL